MQVQQYVYANYATHVNEIRGIFDYINGKVNPHNPCIYNPAYFSRDNFAQFQHPNLVSVFIGSIIEFAFKAKKCGRDGTIRDIVLSIAAMTIAHELTHAEQCIDAFRYKQDLNYRDMIENSAEYNAEIFCMGHKIAIERKFKFEFVCITKTPQTEFPAWTDAGYLYSTIAGVTRVREVIDELKELVANPNNKHVALYLYNPSTGYKVVIPVKVDYKVSLDNETIQYINQLVMPLRNGMGAYEFEFEMSTGIICNPGFYNGEDVEAVILEINEQTYEPFLFN